MLAMRAGRGPSTSAISTLLPLHKCRKIPFTSPLPPNKILFTKRSPTTPSRETAHNNQLYLTSYTSKPSGPLLAYRVVRQASGVQEDAHMLSYTHTTRRTHPRAQTSDPTAAHLRDVELRRIHLLRQGTVCVATIRQSAGVPVPPPDRSNGISHTTG